MKHDFLGAANKSIVGSMDELLLGRRRAVKLTPKFSLPLKPGTRVSFVHGVEALFTYKDCPDPDVLGTVVKVRTASGDRTDHDGRVFVLWDDGRFRSIFMPHLKPEFGSRLASTVCRRIKTSMDLEGFFKSGTDLVHKATRDLWALRKEGDDFVIERLFQDNGEPLKV